MRLSPTQRVPGKRDEATYTSAAEVISDLPFSVACVDVRPADEDLGLASRWARLPAPMCALALSLPISEPAFS